WSEEPRGRYYLRLGAASPSGEWTLVPRCVTWRPSGPADPCLLCNRCSVVAHRRRIPGPAGTRERRDTGEGPGADVDRPLVEDGVALVEVVRPPAGCPGAEAPHRPGPVLQIPAEVLPAEGLVRQVVRILADDRPDAGLEHVHLAGGVDDGRNAPHEVH